VGVELQYAFALQVDGKWRITLATSQPLGVLSTWAKTEGSTHDVALIRFDISDEYEGAGTLYLGSDLVWDESGSQVNIEGDVPPIELDIAAYHSAAP